VPASPNELYEASTKAVVNTFLVLMTNMSHAPMVAASPSAQALALAPVPGTGAPTGRSSCMQGGAPHRGALARPASSVARLRLRPFGAAGGEGGTEAAVPESLAAFMSHIWGVLLAAVLPLWQDVQLLAANPKLVQASWATRLRCVWLNHAQPNQHRHAIRTAAAARDVCDLCVVPEPASCLPARLPSRRAWFRCCATAPAARAMPSAATSPPRARAARARPPARRSRLRTRRWCSRSWRWDSPRCRRRMRCSGCVPGCGVGAAAGCLGAVGARSPSMGSVRRRQDALVNC
jgi:hypothetical protein